jgi:hypothetical protein
MFQLLFFIFFIILIEILSKKIEKAQKKEPQEKEKPYDIFGLPPLEFPLPQTKPKEVKKIPIAKIETEKITPKEEKPKETQAFKPTVKSEIESILDLDTKKLETAIILSEILSPPKALRQ